jgi:predicted transcriptional regulator
MTIKEMRLRLHDAIEHTDDKELLEELNIIIENSTKASDEEWDNLPKEVKDAIEEGLQDARKGRVISHDEFRKKFSK